MTACKWNRSEEGFVESKCGCFSISPLYWGHCNPQSYELTMKTDGRWIKVGSFDTQKEAKNAVENM